MATLSVVYKGAALALTALAVSAPLALAADLVEGTPNAPALRGPVGVMERPRPAYDPAGIRYGNWLFLPELLSTVTFDDNLFATRINRKSAIVSRFIPSVRVQGDFGPTQVGAYVKAEGRLYSRFEQLNSIAPSAGIGFKSEIQRDLIVQARADYAYRIEEPDATRVFTGTTGAFGTGGVPSSLVRYHDASVSGSVNKSFGNLFVSSGAIFQSLNYDNARDVFGNVVNQNFRNANLTTWTTRVGYEFGPGLRAFIEPSVNWRDYYNFNRFNSTGFKIVGGVSSELTRLARGEVYGGYIEQNYDRYFGKVASYTVGARLLWYPTNLLTFTVDADRQIQESGLVTFNGTVGSPIISTGVNARADFELLRNLILSGRFVYRNYKFVRDPRVDDIYTGGATATYLFNRHFRASLDYAYTDGESNALNARFKRNQVTLSLKGSF